MRLSAVLLCATVILSGCQSPFLVFPGGEIQAISAEAEDFSFADNYPTMVLEVRQPDTGQPYSVILRTTVIEGKLYIDAAQARRWGKAIAADPAVRIRLGDRVYNAQAILESNPEITKRFLSGRTVYEIRPLKLRS